MVLERQTRRQDAALSAAARLEEDFLALTASFQVCTGGGGGGGCYCGGGRHRHRRRGGDGVRVRWWVLW